MAQPSWALTPLLHTGLCVPAPAPARAWVLLLSVGCQGRQHTVGQVSVLAGGSPCGPSCPAVSLPSLVCPEPGWCGWGSGRMANLAVPVVALTPHAF